MPDADYNVAPTTHQPIIVQSRETGERETILARWGPVPFFTKDLKDVKGLSTINARSEHPRDYGRWLDREETERLPLDLLRPFESEEMKMYEANPRVNSIKNNGPEMMRAAERAAQAGDLPL